MKKIVLIGLIILSWTNTYAQIPLGEEFTYQGELNDSTGNPHDGLFDFKFVAYDDSDDGAGNNLGQFSAEDVQVTNGIFTTQIDYSILGDEPFMGDKIWLEISVRIGASTGGYQQLLPRQQVTATPYATHAKFVGADAISEIQIQDESITASDIGSNAVGTNEIIASQVQRRVTTVCSSGEFMQSVNQDGTAVCVAETAGLTTVTSAEIVDGTIVADDINKTQVQKRVGTVCSGGRMMRSINEEGVATCIFPNTGADTVVSADIVDGTIQAVDVDNTQIQQRVVGACIYPEYVTSIDANGALICTRPPISLASTLDSVGNFGTSTSIAIGVDGLPIISYYNSTIDDLKIVKCLNQSCSSFDTPSTLDSAGDVGRDLSIAIGVDGFPIISYYDFTNRDLKIVKCLNQSCSSFDIPRTLDSTGDVGSNTSIAIGIDGFPIISYNDFTNGYLKIVRCLNQSCSSNNTPGILDSAGGVGRDTSIAIGSDGFAIISYYDYTNRDLKVAKCLNQICTSSTSSRTLDSVDFVGTYTSIAIGADGFPIISYYDSTNRDLKVVKCLNQSCSSSPTPRTLDTAGDVGASTSIVIGADGFPIISYYDGTNYDLKIVKCRNQTCSSTYGPRTLDSSGDVGFYTSFAIGADDLPIISYYDNSNRYLKVYSCGDERCNN